MNYILIGEKPTKDASHPTAMVANLLLAQLKS